MMLCRWEGKQGNMAEELLISAEESVMANFDFLSREGSEMFILIPASHCPSFSMVFFLPQLFSLIKKTWKKCYWFFSLFCKGVLAKSCLGGNKTKMVKIDGYIKKYGEVKYLKNMSNRWKNIYVTEMNNEY
jgi:hypothetical protein